MKNKLHMEACDEYARQFVSLRGRKDFTLEFEYFLEVLSMVIEPLKFKDRFTADIVGFYCMSMPLEIVDSLGFHPVRLWGCSSAMQRFSSASLPALTCPIVKSCAGAFFFERALEKICSVIVLPNTCVFKFKALEKARNISSKFYIMDVPIVRDTEKGRRRWVEEVYAFRRHLEKYAGKRCDRKKLLSSIGKYETAWKTFVRLLELRRKGLIPGVWFTVLVNSFVLDEALSWVSRVNQLIANYKTILPQAQKPRVFLAGSPIFFPYLKMIELIEDAGMFIVGDSLCSSERLFRGAVYKDTSEYELCESIADKYLSPCKCPVFPDVSQRAKNTLEIMRNYDIKGVVFHVLKGCYLFDVESYEFERLVKESGFYFIRIETDYSIEDAGNIMARLESFKAMLD